MNKRRSGVVVAVTIVCLLAVAWVVEKRHHPALAFQVAQPNAIGNASPLMSGSGTAAATFLCAATDPVVPYYNSTANQISVCFGGSWVAGPKPYLTGTSGTITGTLLAAGAADTGTATVAGATAGMSCGTVAATDGTVMNSFVLSCTVTGSGSNNVTVSVMSPVLGTPPSKAYNFKVFP